eukprot:1159679-Pelagomonas_calceolata.AAC.1
MQPAEALEGKAQVRVSAVVLRLLQLGSDADPASVKTKGHPGSQGLQAKASAEVPHLLQATTLPKYNRPLWELSKQAAKQMEGCTVLHACVSMGQCAYSAT